MLNDGMEGGWGGGCGQFGFVCVCLEGSHYGEEWDPWTSGNIGSCLSPPQAAEQAQWPVGPVNSKGREGVQKHQGCSSLNHALAMRRSSRELLGRDLCWPDLTWPGHFWGLVAGQGLCRPCATLRWLTLLLIHVAHPWCCPRRAGACWEGCKPLGKEERWRESILFSLEETLGRGGALNSRCLYKEVGKMKHSGRRMGAKCKLKHKVLAEYTGKLFLRDEGQALGNRLPPEIMQSLFWEAFKTSLWKALSSLIWPWSSPSFE